MIYHSSVQLYSNTITNFIIRNLELKSPYDLSTIIGNHGFDLPCDIQSNNNILVNLINQCILLPNESSIIKILNGNATKLINYIIAGIPSGIPVDDVMWDILDSIISTNIVSSTTVEKEIVTFLWGIIRTYNPYNSIYSDFFNQSGIASVSISTTYIRFPKYDEATNPSTNCFNIDIWTYVNGNES